MSTAKEKRKKSKRRKERRERIADWHEAHDGTIPQERGRRRDV